MTVSASPDTPPADAVDLATLGQTLGDDVDTIRIGVDLPTTTAVALKHRTNGVLDISETASLLIQLYQAAPMSPGVVVLTSDEYGRICGALGFSPQSNTELVGAVESLVTISVGGVKLRFTAEEVAIINARNATGLTPAEFLKEIWRVMFDAWRNGVIG